jgi:transcription antitermination protein NusB
VTPARPRPPIYSRARLARLAAVQAIYQMELTALDAEAVIAEFVEHRFAQDAVLAQRTKPDPDLFASVVRGVPHRQKDIDRAVVRALPADWKFSRIDSIVRAILRAATYEMIAHNDVPARLLIDEYLGVTHAFFDGDEAGFVNATLDRLAHAKRAAEFGSGDDKPQD